MKKSTTQSAVQLLQAAAQKRLSRQAEAFNAYRAILFRDAHGKSTPDDADQLSEVTEALGITVAEMTADAAKVREYVKACEHANRLPALREIADAKSETAAKARREHVERMRAGEKEVNRLASEATSAGVQANNANAARRKVDEMERMHWQLLGKAKPAPVEEPQAGMYSTPQPRPEPEPIRQPQPDDLVRIEGGPRPRVITRAQYEAELAGNEAEVAAGV